MSSSTPISRARALAKTVLAFTPIIAMAGFFIANRDFGVFFEQPYSWVYLGTLIGFGLLIPLVPYREALWADTTSTVLLALIQLELAYITDWSGFGRLTFAAWLKFGIPLTCLLVIGMLVGRLQLWLQSPSERTNFEQDMFWTQRIGGAIGALVVLLCLTVLTFWIGLGGEATEILGSTTYPSVFMFGVMLLAGFIASRITNQLLRKRREEMGYRARIEPLSEFPEHIVRDVTEADSKLSELELHHMSAVIAVLLSVTILTQILFGEAAIYVFVGGMIAVILYVFIVVLRFRNNYKSAWYETARLRIGETELLRRASLKTSLGWADETDE